MCKYCEYDDTTRALTRSFLNPFFGIDQLGPGLLKAAAEGLVEGIATCMAVLTEVIMIPLLISAHASQLIRKVKFLKPKRFLMFRVVFNSVHRRQVKLTRPPGQRLLRVTSLLFSPKTIALTFKPLIADWHAEYFEAIKNGHHLHARLISLRYYWYYAKACGLSKFAKLFKAVAKS